MTRNHIEATAALYTIEDILINHIKSSQINGIIQGRWDDQAVLLFNFSANKIGRYKYELNQVFVECQNEIRMSLGVDLVAVVSRITGNLSELSRCFHEASDFNRHRVSGKEEIVYIDEYHERKKPEGLFDLDVEDKLMGHILSCDNEAARREAQAVFNRYRMLEREDKSGFQMLMFRFINILHSLIIKLNVDLSEGSSMADLLSFSAGIRTMKGGEQLICDILDELCHITEVENKNRVNLHIERIMVFIDEHYQEDISMEMLAEEVGLSPSYIHRIIKVHSGKTFLEIVVEKKMDKARELLEQNEAVQDVASSLGYSSSRYFIKVFRERYGITPNEYKRKSIRNNNNH